MTVGIVRSGNGTSIGVATTKTLISSASGLFVPADAKALLGVRVMHTIGTPTLAQTVNTQFDLESADIRNMSPYQVLATPIGSGIVATNLQGFTGIPDTWKINAPLAGGEGLNIYGTPLVINTAAPLAQAFLIVSNNVADISGPQLHAKMGTLTAAPVTAAVNTDTAGTKYSFSGGRVITKLFGTYHPKTLTTGDYMTGEIKYSSSEFVDAIPQTLPLNPLSAGLGTSISMLMPGISQQDVFVPVKPGQVNVQDYFNFNGALGSAGSFIDGLMYV